MTDNWLSDCHQAPVKVVGADEGTNHWECIQCGQGCNATQSTIDEQGDSESPELQAKLEEIKSLPQKPSKRIEYALRIIERLLADPIGSQMKHKEIKMMFDLIAIELYPPIIITTKGSDLPTEDSKPSAGHSEAQS